MLAVIDAVDTHGLSAYDAEYVVLAELADADLLTGDAFLAGVAGARANPHGTRHRLAEQAVGYPTRPRSAEAGWHYWPGAVEYMAELRREAASDLEALRSGRGWMILGATMRVRRNQVGLVRRRVTMGAIWGSGVSEAVQSHHR